MALSSPSLALVYMNDAIGSFIEMLEKRKGVIIPGMDIEYCTFILALIESVDESIREEVFNELIYPRHNVPILEVIEKLQG